MHFRSYPCSSSLPSIVTGPTLATVMVMLTGLKIVCAGTPHLQQIEAFLVTYTNAAPLIVIKDGKGDSSNWERFEAEVIDADHVHVPETNPPAPTV